MFPEARMATLAEMFHLYLVDLFPSNAEFVDDDNHRLRIIYPIPETTPEQRCSRPIVLRFEPYVIAEFQAAIDSNNVPRQDRIGDRLCEIVRVALDHYDVHGGRDAAFQIHVDSYATDL